MSKIPIISHVKQCILGGNSSVRMPMPTLVVEGMRSVEVSDGRQSYVQPPHPSFCNLKWASLFFRVGAAPVPLPRRL
jgi:hypothetical protein